MNDELNLRSVLDSIVENMLSGLTDVVPRVLTAIVVLLIGWVFSKIVQRSLQTVLSRVRFDQLLERIGITDTFKRVGLRAPPSRWMPKVVFYLLMIFILRIATQAVGLTDIANAINSALAFVPNVFAALLIILLGNVIAQFTGRAVTAAARDSGIDYASVLGKLTASLVLFVVMIMAIAQLKINMDIVNSVVLIAFAGFGLAFALSFGLGTREITRNIIAGFYVRKAVKIGDDVEINGERGTVSSYTPIVTLIEREGRRIAIPNSAFLTAIGKR